MKNQAPCDLVIVCCGGLAREAAWVVERINAKCERWNLLGFAVNEPPEETLVNGYPVWGNDEALLSWTKPLSVVIAAGNPVLRRKIVKKLSANPKLDYPAIVDTSVMLSPTAELGRGCLLLPGSVVSVNTVLGDFCLVNPGCVVSHDARIGSFVSLYSGVSVAGGVTIGDGAEIGTGVQIIQYKSIGPGSVVGAGAAVVRDIPAYCIAMGVPARPVRSLENPNGGDAECVTGR